VGEERGKGWRMLVEKRGRGRGGEDWKKGGRGGGEGRGREETGRRGKSPETWREKTGKSAVRFQPKTNWFKTYLPLTRLAFPLLKDE
jgi:hypothetical protein